MSEKYCQYIKPAAHPNSARPFLTAAAKAFLSIHPVLEASDVVTGLPIISLLKGTPTFLWISLIEVPGKLDPD